MFLIYVSAKEEKTSASTKGKLPEPDLQPIMLALSKPGLDYILREADSREVEAKKPEGHESIERIFVRLRSADDASSGDGNESEISPESFDESMDATDARMAVALATIYFAEGQVEPNKSDYVRHIKDRTRLADKVVVAGYTDPDCSMEQSEALGLKRALKVRKALLEEGGIKVPIVAISRPKCCYTEDSDYARRVEVTALFDGRVGGDDGSSSGAKEENGSEADDDDSTSMAFSALVAKAVPGGVQ